MRKSLMVVVHLVGCSPAILPAINWSDSGTSGSDESEWSSGTASSDGDAADRETEEGDGSASLENPSLSYVSAACLANTVAFWQLELVATDPQGINTLSSTATCEIYPVGVSEADPTHTVRLQCDGEGRCGQNYDGEDEGVLCSGASNWDFHFNIMDEDGYVSTVEVVTGIAE